VSTNTALTNLQCWNNRLSFSTLRLPGYFLGSRNFGSQIGIPITLAAGNIVDLSRENVNDATTYTWYYNNGTQVRHALYTAANGVFTFTGLQKDDVIYCEMTNTGYPGMRVSTTRVTVDETVDPVNPPTPPVTVDETVDPVNPPTTPVTVDETVDPVNPPTPPVTIDETVDPVDPPTPPVTTEKEVFQINDLPLTSTDVQKKDTLAKVMVGKKNKEGAPTYSTLTLFLPGSNKLLKKNGSQTGYDHVQIQVWDPKNSAATGQFQIWTTLLVKIENGVYVSEVQSTNAAFHAEVNAKGKLEFSGLDAGTKYAFQIQAVTVKNDTELRSKVLNVSGTTLKYTAVQKLKAPKADITSSSMTLEWQASKALPAGTATRYEIVWMADGVEEGSKIVDATTAAVITETVDGLKQSGKKYTFIVKALATVEGGDIASLTAKVSAKTK